MNAETRLAPPQAFDAENSNADIRAECGLTTPPEETGPHSRTVRNRIARSCAGWPDQPTAQEFHDALRAQTPTRRQQNLISMWMLEEQRGRNPRVGQGGVHDSRAGDSRPPRQRARRQPRAECVPQLAGNGMTAPTTLPEPAAELLRRTRHILDEFLTPVTPGRTGWTLTGGTVLAARWKHRESTDLDLVVHPRTEIARLAKARNPQFWSAMEAAGATKIDLDGTPTIHLAKGKVELVRDEEHRRAADAPGRTPRTSVAA